VIVTGVRVEAAQRQRDAGRTERIDRLPEKLAFLARREAAVVLHPQARRATVDVAPGEAVVPTITLAPVAFTKTGDALRPKVVAQPEPALRILAELLASREAVVDAHLMIVEAISAQLLAFGHATANLLHAVGAKLVAIGDARLLAIIAVSAEG